MKRGAHDELPLLEHLRELRTRLVWISAILVLGVALTFTFAPTIYAWLQTPLLRHLPPGSTFVALGLMEGWLVYFKVALAAGLFLTSPLWLYQVWAFIAPGLIKRERKLLSLVGCSSAVCFILGGLFCYGVIMPYGFVFLTSLFAGTNITFLPQMDAYFSLVLKLMVAFGLIFELPIVIVFLVRWDIVSLASLRSHRRHMIVGAFIIAAIITPTIDVLNQFLMALPLILLFEVGLFASWLTTRDRKSIPDKGERAGPNGLRE